MAKDVYHDTVRNALIKDGWTITHDPLRMPFGDHNLYVDLGAEKLIAAEKSGLQIAVEIKSFISRSQVNDLENALGQYVLYRSLLRRLEPSRNIYLAVPQRVYEGILSSPLGHVALQDLDLNLLIFDQSNEVIHQWIRTQSTEE